jgi:pimeloyl-ACP methyl ester carboxylesterase
MRYQLLSCSLLFGACAASESDTPPREPLEQRFDPSDWLPESPFAIGWLPCGEGFECAKVSVPIDYDNPWAGSMRVALERRPAVADRLGVLFINPGGPGFGIVGGLEGHLEALGPAADRFDVIAMDPRGVGKSTPVYCNDPLPLLGLQPAVDPSDASAVAERDRQNIKLVVDSCVLPNWNTAAQLSTANVARDMDRVRALLGEEQISYVGYSYGTLLGAHYAELFPQRVRAMVLDGALDTTASLVQAMVGMAGGAEDSLLRFLSWCDSDPVSAPWAASGALAAFDALVAKLDAQPLDVEGTPLYGRDILSIATSGLYAGRPVWPSMARLLGQVIDGDGEGVHAVLTGNIDSPPLGKLPNTVTTNWIYRCNDYPKPTADEVSEGIEAGIAASAHFGARIAQSLLFCSQWPHDGAQGDAPVAEGAPPIVVVGTTHDPSTPYQDAQALSAQLATATLLTLEGDGHCAILLGDACIQDAVSTYLVDLQSPAPDTVCQQSTEPPATVLPRIIAQPALF